MSVLRFRTVLMWPVLVLALWLLAAGVAGPYTARLGEVTGTDQSAVLPQGAESAAAAAELRAGGQSESLPLVVLWTGESPLVLKRSAPRAEAAMAALTARHLLVGAPEPVVLSAGETALMSVVQLGADLGPRLPAALDEVRRAAETVPGMRVHLAGPAAAQGDLQEVFDGIDGTLLGVAMAAVLLILLLVYRSVLLPVLVTASALLALSLACGCLYGLANSGLLPIDGQVQGILFVLVIGATTDYGLLLCARYREELEHGADVATAVGAAWRRSAPPVAASAATVALALGALLLSDLPGNRALGPAGALAMACSLLGALTFLPAGLVLCGRAAFWPRPSRRPSAPTVSVGVWLRIAGLVARAPRRVWAGALVLLVAAAAFAPVLSARGVPLDRSLPATAPSVTAQAALARHFPGGAGSPAIVLTDVEHSVRILSALSRTAGVAAVAAVPPPGAAHAPGARVQVAVTLSDVADSPAAQAAIGRVRAVAHEVGGAQALVAGQAAQIDDMQRAASRDRSAVFPVVLAVILLILVCLLRCVLMPLILIGAVTLTFLAALGISAAVFLLTTGSAETEQTIVLYAFVFLVALGADYNIFLMHRVREEALSHDTRTGSRLGLVTTGGVISSAGVVLAATFAALTVMPLLYLVHIGVIVAVGVLLDTLLVRLFLVPALIEEIGPAIWWPRTLPSDHPTGAAALITPQAAPPLPQPTSKN